MRFVKTIAVAALLALGSAAIAEERVREAKASKIEQLALDDLDRRRAELHEQARRLDAEVALVLSEIAAHHRFAENERLAGYDVSTGIFRIATVAPAASSTPAAVGSR